MSAPEGAGTLGPAARGRSLKAALAIAVALAVFVRALPFGYSSSPDVAHHYALIRWLMTHWAVASDSAPVLGEMSVYPRYAHILAAIVGTVVHSPFLGMQLVTTAALVGCWLLIAYLARLVPGQASWRFTGVLVLLLALNRMTFDFDLIGHEIVVNFFYSQLVGQVVFFFGLAVCARYETTRGFGVTAPLISIGLAIFAAGIHLLPAIEGVAYGLLLLGVRAISERKSLVWRLSATLAVSLVAGAAIYLHPSFAAMRAISENNGYLPLASLNSLSRIIGLATTTGLVSLALIWRSLPWHRFQLTEGVAISRHVGCAGAAIAALCLMQALAAGVGVGSDYACRKYAFALSTFLITGVALLVSQSRLRAPSRADSKQAPWATWLQPAIIVAALWIFTFSRSPREFDVPAFLSLERAATVAKESGALSGPKYAYARGLVLGGLTNVSNYLVSQAIFDSPRDENGLAPLYDVDFPAPQAVGAIFSSTKSPSVWSDASCIRTRFDSGFVVSDGSCILAKFSDACRDTINFSSSGFVPGAMMEGFGTAEAQGRWTIAAKAAITCRYKPGTVHPTLATLAVQPFSPKGRPQDVTVLINGTNVGAYKLEQATVLELPIPAGTVQSDKLVIALQVKDPISPRSAGVNADGRELGLLVKELVLR